MMIVLAGVAVATPVQAQQQGFVGAGCSQAASEALNDAALLGVEREVAVIDQQIDRPEALADLSCLERIMNSGVDIFFQPPNIGDIMSRIENAVCGAAEDAWATATQPINQALYRSVDMGGFVPGGGSYGGGVNVGARRGDGRSGSFVNVGVGGPNGGRVRVEAPPVEVPDVRLPEGGTSDSGSNGGSPAVWNEMFR